MLTGARSGSVRARVRSQSASPQANSLAVMTDAVAGGTSVAKAIGSAWSTVRPSAPCTRYL